MIGWTRRKALMGLALAGLAVQLVSAGAVLAADLPELPRVYIDTTYAAPTGNIVTVNAGGNLQTALNNAQLGDTIVLQAGATFTGPFILPNKTTGSGWIHIRSGNYSSLPGPGRRVSPSDATNMPKIVGPYLGSGVIETATSAHHYRFVGIEIKPSPGQFFYNLVVIGWAAGSTNDLPHDITFDRCYVHGDPTVGGRRGIAMNAISGAVVDSYVSDFKEIGSDSQAILVWNTPGPTKIANNYLEGSTENLHFGGVDPTITNLVPSDIEIRHNYFFKPLSWMSESWAVKNLLEFKNAQRVLVEGNMLENNWPNAQSGFSLLITPRNQDGTAPWSGTRDITIRYNRMKNLGSGINILDRDAPNVSQATCRILIENNVLDITGLGHADGRTFQVLSGMNGVTDLSIAHNTAFNTAYELGNSPSSDFGMMDGTNKNDRFVFADNLVSHGVYGFFGGGVGGGTACLNAYFTNWSFSTNAIIGPDEHSYYPTGNYFPADNTAVGFVDYAGGDYRLSSSSPYKNAGTDGKDLGADIEAVTEVTIGCVSGKWYTPRGTPYAWMVRYGWTTNQDAIDEQDTDGDGMKTWQEYVAGTDPTNAASRLQVASGEWREGTDFVLQWQSVTGKLYSIQASTNLTGGFPLTMATNIAGMGGSNSWTVQVNQASEYFRVKVE